MAIFLRQCQFQNLPLLSQKSLLTTKFDWLPQVNWTLSALALENEDSMNKEKHSLRNFAVRGSYSKFFPTSIVTFDTKEENFENEKWI